MERKFRKQEKELARQSALGHPLSEEDRDSLGRVVKGIRVSAENSNLDFRTESLVDFQGHAMYGRVTISGLTTVKQDKQVAADQINKLVIDLIERLTTQKKRKGLSVQISFIPTESIYLLYGREGGLMTTAWAYAQDRPALEGFAPAAQRMVAAMLRNGWDITKVNVMLMYDNVLAHEGISPKKPKTRRK